jgi:hypothetical protein
MTDASPLPAIFVQDRIMDSVVNVSAPLGAGSTTLGTSPPTIALSADGSAVAFDWNTYDASFPTFAVNQQVYRIALRAGAPAAIAAVPTLAQNALILLVLLLALGASAATFRALKGRRA